MRWEVRLAFTDRDGNTRTCAGYVEGLNTVAELEAFANQFGDVVSALSTAQLVSARATARVPITVATTAQPGSDVRRKGVLILKDDLGGIGSVEFPSPSPSLPWDAQGPYAGFRVTQAGAQGHAIATLIANLPPLVRPDGQPMPSAQWVIAAMHDL